MNPLFDTIIVGAGLAGACAALHLSRAQQVLVVEAEHPAAGASGAAAGLVNPLMGRKANTVWRAEEALAALAETVHLAEAEVLFETTGLVRPAAHKKQAQIFREVAEVRPAYAAWLPLAAATERVPGLVAAEGALVVRRGGAIQVPAFVEALLAAARRNGADLQTGVRVVGWGEGQGLAFVETQAGQRLTAKRVLLALGYGFRHHAPLTVLNLHAIKGQTVRVAKPPSIDLALPLAGRGYIVPEGETLIVGSSYERGFTDLAPSETQTRTILAKATRMLPALRQAAVLDATAGVRVTVPGTRLPMLGPLPGRQRVWIFSGLGSKGLLMAPLLARNLPLCFTHPERIPGEVRVQ